MSEYTPEGLRSDAPEMYVDSAIVITTAGQLRAHADLIERCERLEQELEEAKSRPWLGLATTGQLIAELQARCEVNGTINYKTVGSEVDECSCPIDYVRKERN